LWPRACSSSRDARLPADAVAACRRHRCAADASDIDDEDFLDGKADGATTVNIDATNLDVQLDGLTAVATIDLERNGNVVLEVGGLAISKITDDRGTVATRSAMASSGSRRFAVRS